MSLAAKKAAYIKQKGNSCTIIRSSGNVSTIGRIIAMKRKTGFFSINFLREAFFAPDCELLPGDLVRNETTAELFFVMGFQNKTLGGSLSSISAELYMVNYANVSFARIQQTHDTNGNLNRGATIWNPVADGPANVEHVSGSEQRKDGLLLPNTVFWITCQATSDLMLKDRCLIDGKPHSVDDIDLSIAPGMQVIQVSVDERK